MHCEASGLCEEVINIGGRSHVYVSSRGAVDSSLGTKGSGFLTHVLYVCVRERDRDTEGVFDCSQQAKRRERVQND